MKKIISLFISFVLLISVSGCGTSSPIAADEPNPEFTQFLDDFIIASCQDDYITMHQYFENPEKYGIDPSKVKISLGDFVAEEEDEEDPFDLDRRFEDFDFLELDRTQQAIYRQIEFISDLYDQIDDEDFDYLENAWSTVNGTHQVLVQFFGEYDLRKEEDILPLLQLIQDVPRYTQAALDYAKEQAHRDLLMMDYDEVVADCKDILNSQSDSSIVKELFQEIDNLDLDSDLSDSYKEEIKDAIDTYFYPSYQVMIDGLAELKDDILPLQGLSHFKKGEEYYEYLVADATGSEESVYEIQSNLNDHAEEAMDELYELVNSNPDIFDDVESLKTPFQSMDEILTFLENNYTKEFPALSEFEYSATPLAPEQSQEGIMAYFLIPAIDNSRPYTIRYNQKDYGNDASSVELYSTLAHEGLPGHMYQSHYNSDLFVHPIQNMLSNLGFTEGYATYIEMESLNFLDLEEDVKKAYALNTEITNDYVALMDFSIHYDGMSLEEFTDEYEDLFGSDLEDIYNQIADCPATFLSYYYGFVQIDNLKKEAEEELGNQFDPKEFHTALLMSGSAPFSIVEKNINYYIDEKR